jgi:hypothetical protein
MDGQIAEHYSKFDGSRLSNIIVLPPYEPRDTTLQWVRGFLRYNNGDSFGPRDFVVTGPKLRVVYGGCRWSRLVLALPPSGDDESVRFRDWLSSVVESVKSKIWDDPAKYRAGATSNNRFTFDTGFIKKSSDPAMYPDELSTRLSTTRVKIDDAETADVVDAQIFTEGPDGPIAIEDFNEIEAGGYITHIFRISYNRNCDRFGLVLTVLKARYLPSDKPKNKPDNGIWQFDYPMDTSN